MRPPLARELQGYRPFENSALVDPNQRVITLSENLQSLTANGGSAQSPDNGMVGTPTATSCTVTADSAGHHLIGSFLLW